MERLELAIALADRTASRTALMFLDLDNFKTINDSFGHAVGDLLLQAVASRLMLCIRDSDTICRQGGDEFLIVLGNVADADAITVVTRKILEALAPTFNIEGKELSTSSSIGIAVFPDDGRDIDTLLKRADTAMYHAKEAGRNAYSFFTEQMNLDAVEHQQVRVGLLHAMERGEFRLHYQPQIDINSGKVIGAEALIRWQHPERGLLMPDHFIRIAEESGLIVPIGAWVLREACRQAAAWRKTGLPPLVIAVNVSAIQFKRGDIEACVRQALDESGLPANCLELELTESVLIHDTDKVLATVQRLKALGVMLSIDDFGTGYSSLSYLTRFKVDKLKIDRSFVCDLENQPGNASMVRAIIQMARSLNLTTIAEGVEDLELVNFLRRQNCQEAQGYYHSRPWRPSSLPDTCAVARPHRRPRGSNGLHGGPQARPALSFNRRCSPAASRAAAQTLCATDRPRPKPLVTVSTPRANWPSSRTSSTAAAPRASARASARRPPRPRNAKAASAHQRCSRCRAAPPASPSSAGALAVTNGFKAPRPAAAGNHASPQPGSGQPGRIARADQRALGEGQAKPRPVCSSAAPPRPCPTFRRRLAAARKQAHDNSTRPAPPSTLMNPAQTRCGSALNKPTKVSRIISASRAAAGRFGPAMGSGRWHCQTSTKPSTSASEATMRCRMRAPPMFGCAAPVSIWP
jgi:diguanylate cyclase (GGDEF)-like protein